MSLEARLVELIKLRCERVFPDVAPFGTVTPYVIYEQIGGTPLAYLDGSLPDKRNAHIQITSWADTRLAATELALQLEEDLCASTVLNVSLLSGQSGAFSDVPDRRGTKQDFSVWADR